MELVPRPFFVVLDISLHVSHLLFMFRYTMRITCRLSQALEAASHEQLHFGLKSRASASPRPDQAFHQANPVRTSNSGQKLPSTEVSAVGMNRLEQ